MKIIISLSALVAALVMTASPVKQAEATTYHRTHVHHVVPHHYTPRSYTRMLAAKEGWVGIQWTYLDEIVQAESGWDVCAVYPSRHICNYSWSKYEKGNSCGLGQAAPCPTAWKGRLGKTWKEQAQRLITYIKGRYGSPSQAIAFRRVHNWY